MAVAEAAGDAQRFMALDTAFHAALLRAAGYSFLSRIWVTLDHVLLAEAREPGVAPSTGSSDRRSVLATHRRLLAAIESRNDVDARAALRVSSHDTTPRGQRTRPDMHEVGP
jgi:DNA-binding GntR family transcriptional regulator